MTSEEREGRAVCVSVDGSRRIVNGLDWKTTARDVIRSLRPRTTVPHILVESWQGCLRPIGEEEFVCQILEEWGEEARDVRLILMTSHSLPGHRYSRRVLDANKIYQAQRHGKVAANKRRCLSVKATPKRELGKEIARLVARAEVARERLTAVEELEKRRLDDPDFSELDLTPSEEEEWVALQEQLTEEEEEARELDERKKELRGKIETQSSDMAQVKRRSMELQRKLSQEKEKHERLNGGEEYEELEEAQEQVKRLRNELKIRHKMNQLQTNKMQEVSALISALEDDCSV
ncbi:hypothetical protein GBAR_LOCUS6271 [Geodia barretti]|uniref:Ras association domain-containing protein n=1 Tax=Geodia barretti TaxID=519541 RepID=A0AA35RD67_GEOBA|nr:hypothetical protein GBAR_LOCUS6271 [Geodia barretti]